MVVSVTGLIGYRRVSTAQQGQSGLGLEAQLAALQAYSKQTGRPLIAVYTEVESGKVSDRPELKKALAHAKRNKACLCVARLDRLSRNVAFLSAIMDSGADFVAIDNPAATRLVLHILIAVAEAFFAISQRTRQHWPRSRPDTTVASGERPKARANCSDQPGPTTGRAGKTAARRGQGGGTCSSPRKGRKSP